MDLHDFVRLVRTRWVTICITAVVTLIGAIIYTVVTTPLYEASTRLFVSTTSGQTTNDLYQGNRLSQDRVLSYTELVMGTTLAQRTIDRLNLDMSAGELRENVVAKSKPGTVLINVSVVDESPVRARDIANALSDEFVAMVRELETPARGGTPEARVVVEQRATIPGSPVVPKPLRNIAMGFALGIMLGVGIAVLRGLLDNTVKDKEILEELTSSGVVGMVPFDKTRRQDPAITFEADSSPTAEAFRKLRTNLKFLSVDDPPRLIVVTSSVPNEGKSTTSINIALALAEADHRVLLVDGDMRKPSLDKYLDVVGSAGFSTVLSGAASLDEVVQESKFPRLSILASGPIPPNPSELLGSTAAKKSLSEMRVRYDYVIIDTPPVLAVTDSSILSAEADGALILARAGKTKREQLTHAVETLNDVGAKILGTILTMVPTSGRSAYSYGYYYRSYDSQRDQLLHGPKATSRNSLKQ